MRIILFSVFSLLTGLAFSEPHDDSKAHHYVLADGKKSIVLPKLLTQKFHAPDDVCKDALAKKKSFVIVALKSHACDCGLECNFCMEETRNLADPANLFVKENFALYHTRITRNEDQKDFGLKVLPMDKMLGLPGAREIVGAWGKKMKDSNRKLAPGMILLDAEKCRVLGFIDMEKISLEKGKDGKSRNREERATDTNTSIRDALRIFNPTSDVLRAVYNDVRNLDAVRARMNPELTLIEINRVIDMQWEREVGSPPHGEPLPKGPRQ